MPKTSPRTVGWAVCLALTLASVTACSSTGSQFVPSGRPAARHPAEPPHGVRQVRLVDEPARVPHTATTLLIRHDHHLRRTRYQPNH